MAFADPRTLVQMLPEDKKKGIEATYDGITANVSGFSAVVKVTERTPYSRICYSGNAAGTEFCLTAVFGDMGGSGKTDFSLELAAELNFMMKMMVGDKIEKGLDKVVDSLVAISEGRMPEGVDPSMFR